MFSKLGKAEALVLVVLTLVIIVEIIFLVTGILNLDKEIQTQKDPNMEDTSFITDIAQSVLSNFNRANPTPSQVNNAQPPITQDRKSTPESLSYVNCGIINNDKSDSEIQNIVSCFDDRFNSCLPSRVEFNLNVLNQSISYFFQIEGARKGRCIVAQGYNDHPSSQLEKSMTCRYLSSDGSILGSQSEEGFEFLSEYQGLQELNKNQCSGPLYDSLRALLISSQSQNPDCSLNVNVLQIKLPIGTGFSVTASGFKGSEEEVLWAAEDSNIVNLSSRRGSSVQVIKNRSGNTRVLVIDSSIDDCQIAIDVMDI